MRMNSDNEYEIDTDAGDVAAAGAAAAVASTAASGPQMLLPRWW